MNCCDVEELFRNYCFCLEFIHGNLRDAFLLYANPDSVEVFTI